MRVIFLALLFANVRGTWLAARWGTDSETALAPMRLNETFGDKLSDQLPAFLWPKAKFIFYGLVGLELAAVLLYLLAPSQGSYNR